MSSIPLPPIVQALIDPLRHALQDQDPYVRKTAAIAYVVTWFMIVRGEADQVDGWK